MKPEPMLAETATNINTLNWSEYIAEPKLDGVRCLAVLTGQGTVLWGRGNFLSPMFPEFGSIHKRVRKPCVLDGELVSADFSFSGIQHRVHRTKPLDIRIASRKYPAIYYVFDMLSVDEQDITRKPLVERKKMLRESLVSDHNLRYLPHSEDGLELFQQARDKGMEGIMAKRKKSHYQPKRSPDWLKIKNFQESDFWICGLTKGENGRAFGSLILSDDDGNYVGNCGSGFTEEQVSNIRKVMERIRGDCPFSEKPNLERELLFWTRPILKCEVRYLEKGDKLRFPTFRRFKTKCQ